MSLRRSSCRSALLLIAALATCACELDTTRAGINAVGPSPLGQSDVAVNVARGAQIQPTLIQPVPFARPLCPAFPPFLAPFTVVFEGDGRTERFFTGIDMQFVDRFGVAGGLLTFGRTELVNRFGSTTLPLFGTRAFPFSFPFGCVGAPTGTLTVVVFAADSFGRVASSRVHVTIR